MHPTPVGSGVSLRRKTLWNILIAPKSGEVTGTVHKRPYFHAIGRNVVHQAIAEYEYFSNGRVIQFRDHAAALGEHQQMPGCFERAVKHPKSVLA